MVFRLLPLAQIGKNDKQMILVLYRLQIGVEGLLEAHMSPTSSETINLN